VQVSAGRQKQRTSPSTPSPPRAFSENLRLRLRERGTDDEPDDIFLWKLDLKNPAAHRPPNGGAAHPQLLCAAIRESSSPAFGANLNSRLDPAGRRAKCTTRCPLPQSFPRLNPPLRNVAAAPGGPSAPSAQCSQSAKSPRAKPAQRIGRAARTPGARGTRGGADGRRRHSTRARRREHTHRPASGSVACPRGNAESHQHSPPPQAFSGANTG
jgi:hypothetical protein